MSFRSLLGAMAAVALAIVASMGLTTAASAATTGSYSVVSGDATVSATTVSEGGTVTVAGDNFCPGTRVTLTVTNNGSVYITKRLRADSAGDVSTTVKLTREGTNTIKLRGQTSDCNGQMQVLGVKVGVGSGAAGAGADNASDLPSTGGVDLTPLWAGLGLLVAGSLLVSVAQSRRRITV